MKHRDWVAPEFPVAGVRVDGEPVEAFAVLGAEAAYAGVVDRLYNHAPRAFLDLVREGLGVVKAKDRTGTAPPRFRSRKDVEFEAAIRGTHPQAGTTFTFTVRSKQHGT